MAVDSSRYRTVIPGDFYKRLSAVSEPPSRWASQTGRIDTAMSTGDRGFLDAEGRLIIAGREDDMILSGGENVYPQEIENLLADHPDVADVAVIGVDDAEFGQRLKAFAVLRPGHVATAADLTAHLKTQVARYKIPREIVLLDELPRNPTGKVLKRALPH